MIKIDDNFHRDMHSKALIATGDKYAQYKRQRAAIHQQRSQKEEILELKRRLENLEKVVETLRAIQGLNI